MTARDEVRELRATIEAITGKVPQSHDLDYLRERVRMLVPKVSTADTALDSRATELIAMLSKRGGGAVGQHFARALHDTLGVERALMISELARIKSQDPIDVVNRAIDEYAVRPGFGNLVEHAKRRRDERGRT